MPGCSGHGTLLFDLAVLVREQAVAVCTALFLPVRVGHG